MTDSRPKQIPFVTLLYAAFAVLSVIAFLAYRGDDVGRLGELPAGLAHGPLFGDPIPAVPGIMIAIFIALAWLGLGRQLFALIPVERPVSLFLEVGIWGALGASVWSLVWCIAGLLGEYTAPMAIACTLLGMTMLVIPDRNRISVPEPSEPGWKTLSTGEWALVALVAIPVILALIGSLAPPTAKDTLLYHFAVPKAFVAQHSNAFIDGNIASYLALGTEMHVVWAMLLGNIFTPQAAEAGGGATTFLFFPLLLMVTYGWAREIGTARSSSLITALTVAAVPTVYHVAASAYIDLASTLYVTLAVYALTRWWKLDSRGWAIIMGICLGAALSIKLTAVVTIAAFALILLLRARGASDAGRILINGFTALLLAGVIASPWYLHTWRATGSPVFPFYMSIWKGEANGWDVERSNLFQSMNSQYGGVDVNKTNLLTAPVRLSLTAQPEQARFYDGVLGVSFLIGIPLLVWALWKFDMAVEVKLGSSVAAILYLFWLFSSEQLRYLLPILPVLAVCIVASAEAITSSVRGIRQVLKYSFVAAGIAGLLTTFAWFCQRAPLRVVLGGEQRDEYLARNLDYYPYYQKINSDTPPDARVWLINMRRDTYNIDRPVVSDYLFEDWTLRQMLGETRSVEELRARAAAMNVQYVLARHDFLFDYDHSTLVDDKKPRSENEAKLRIAKAFLLDPARTIKADDKFSLIKVF